MCTPQYWVNDFFPSQSWHSCFTFFLKKTLKFEVDLFDFITIKHTDSIHLYFVSWKWIYLLNHFHHEIKQIYVLAAIYSPNIFIIHTFTSILPKIYYIYICRRSCRSTSSGTRAFFLLPPPPRLLLRLRPRHLLPCSWPRSLPPQGSRWTLRSTFEKFWVGDQPSRSQVLDFQRWISF